jgi:hypothetical protein
LSRSISSTRLSVNPCPGSDRAAIAMAFQTGNGTDTR